MKLESIVDLIGIAGCYVFENPLYSRAILHLSHGGPQVGEAVG